MTVPRIFATQPPGNVPASYLDVDFAATALLAGNNVFVGNQDITGDIAVTGNETITGDLGATGEISGEVTATGSTVAQTLANRFGLVLNLKDFGATGDGVTNDAAAVQAAVDAVLTAGGGALFIPAGNYIVNSAITVGSSVGRGANCYLTLMGVGTTSILTAGASIAAVVDVTGKNFCMEGVALVSGGVATSGLRINTASADADWSATIEKCSFYSFTNGIRITSGQQYGISKCWFQGNAISVNVLDDGRNSYFEHNTHLGDTIGYQFAKVATQCEGSLIRANTIYITPSSSAGIAFFAGLGVTIDSNIIDQAGTSGIGIFLQPTTGNAIAQFNICNNWITGGAGGYSVFADGTGNPVSDLRFISNEIQTSSGSPTAGISAGSVVGVKVIANNFHIVGGGADISLGGSTGVDVLANTSSNGSSNATTNALANALSDVSYIRTVPVTVANLPSAATVGAGARMHVSNATMALTAGIGTIVAGIGANSVPVVSDGSNWLIG